MNATLTNAMTVIGLFGGALAVVTALASIERIARGIKHWRGGRGRDGTEP